LKKKNCNQGIDISLLAYILSAISKREYMKTILVIATAVAFCSCAGPRELEAEMVNAQLIRIDTAFRYANDPKQILLWRDDNNVDYITYASMNNSFLLGSRMVVLVKR